MSDTKRFLKIPYDLLEDKSLILADKVTISLIMSWGENGKECFMGNEYLAEVLGVSPSAASKRIMRLKNLGLINLKYEFKKGKKIKEKRTITIKNPQKYPIVQVSPILPDVSPILPDVSPILPNVSPILPNVSPILPNVSPNVGGIKQDTKLRIEKDKINDQYTGLNLEKSKLNQIQLESKLEKSFPSIDRNLMFEYILKGEENNFYLITDSSLTEEQKRLCGEYRDFINLSQTERNKKTPDDIQGLVRTGKEKVNPNFERREMMTPSSQLPPQVPLTPPSKLSPLNIEPKGNEICDT